MTQNTLRFCHFFFACKACAYDRFHFGQPGSGRIAIGLYHAFLHRWLQV